MPTRERETRDRARAQRRPARDGCSMMCTGYRPCIRRPRTLPARRGPSQGPKASTARHRGCERGEARVGSSKTACFHDNGRSRAKTKTRASQRRLQRGGRHHAYSSTSAGWEHGSGTSRRLTPEPTPGSRALDGVRGTHVQRWPRSTVRPVAHASRPRTGGLHATGFTHRAFGRRSDVRRAGFAGASDAPQLAGTGRHGIGAPGIPPTLTACVGRVRCT
jgi:hypothetical protein